MPFGSCQAGRTDADGHLPIAVSRAKASSSQIRIDALATIHARQLVAHGYLADRRSVDQNEIALKIFPKRDLAQTS